ncbi:MAG: alpha/beta fold hydrolase [Chloroflexia bacterium]
MRRSTVAAVAGAALLAAARKIADAPPDPGVAARAEAASYSGPWTHGYATVNGVRLHYAEIGAGPLVVLLHGFPECWYTWHRLLPRLAERFHVIAPDMRGYNWSDKPPGVASYKLDAVGHDIVSLIDAFGAERAHIVGHDWGGSVAWHLGMFHPDRVDKLTVINAPHPVAFQREAFKSGQVLRSWYIFFFQLPILPEAVARLTLRQSLRGSAATPGAFSDEALDIYQNGLSQPGAATAMLSYYRATFRDTARLANQTRRTIDRPTLLIWGMRDVALSPQLTYDLDSWVPNLRVERVHDSGHWVPEERPTLVGNLLEEFLSA